MRTKLAAIAAAAQITAGAIREHLRSLDRVVMEDAAIARWQSDRRVPALVLVPAQDIADYRDHPEWSEEY